MAKKINRRGRGGSLRIIVFLWVLLRFFESAQKIIKSLPVHVPAPDIAGKCITNPLAAEYEDELVAFDKGIHDDQVDVTSYGARCLVQTFADDESEPVIIGI